MVKLEILFSHISLKRNLALQQKAVYLSNRVVIRDKQYEVFVTDCHKQQWSLESFLNKPLPEGKCLSLLQTDLDESPG